MAMIKTKREIALLKKSAQISNSCIPVIEKSLKEDGITEKEISRRIRRKIYIQGAKLAFRTLVASGKRSSMIHSKPAASDRIVSGGGYVDFGASYKGYKTDVTVPFIKGKSNQQEKKVVRTVLDAYKLTLKVWKFGIPCWKLHEKIDDYIESKGLHMRHNVGHGVGLKIHGRPIMGKPRRKLSGKMLKKWERIQKVTFQKNMVFAIEPGAYVKGVFGCRIENTFLVDGKRLIPLTKSKLIEV